MRAQGRSHNLMLIGKNKRKMGKKALCLIFAFLLSIESFAAVVSDNDGAAFVTKAEFDALKRNFNDQINKYNTSIDSKIDGAIANYLAGIKLSQESYIELDSKTNYTFPLLMQSSVSHWNDYTKTDFFNLARNRVRYYGLMNISFCDTTVSNAVVWNSETEDAILSIPAGDRNSNTIYGVMQHTTTEIPGKSGELYEVKSSGTTRTISGTNYKVFDIVNNGSGYQYIDYVKTLTSGKGGNAGHFTHPNVFRWCYSGMLCTVDAAADQYRWDSGVFPNGVNWTETRCVAVGRGAGNNPTKYANITASHLGERLKIKEIPEANSGGSGGFDYNDVAIDSSQFVWERAGTKAMVYAGTALLPAQQEKKFAYEPQFYNQFETSVEKLTIRNIGYHMGWAYRPGSTGVTSGKFLARAMIYCPYLRGVNYNGYATTIPSFCALPASCVRYYDDNGKVHYMDEGMFLRNFDENCEKVEFDLVFGTKSGTKNLNFYLSKYPFDRVNAKTKLAKFKVDNETSEVTSKTLQTGKSYHITVADIFKNEQLYILWEPTTSTDYITLNSFKNFKQTTE